ncbi:hypothetical protein [Arthrobacter sp. FW306-2-2C-D06B]|uniref:hypothetical protein n=1 Tax=Arthrobacter sp. FW306-2-2C-D06B TaxID=2879618 RepID=UPI001F1644FA|nr:hypothetical protein [Arthrobacter sp. FW306-2-2C-D06B]UKA60000.1 hypothetical protein LFT47_06585 [Arthrobacter sp. FW306-2-2C-D06B]
MKAKRWMKTGSLAAAKAAVTAALLSLVLGVGSAYAYWSTIGIGSGSAAAGDMQTVTVDALVAGDSPATTLVPGGSAEVIVRANNPNAFTVQVYSFIANGAATADSAHPLCTTTGVTFNAPAAPLTPSVSIPANSSVLITLPAAASMSTASQSSCQGAVFHLPVTMAVRK